MNTCGSRLRAIDHANANNVGYKASGVGAVVCARHTLVRRSGVTDLQRGERFLNMDYILFQTISKVKISQLMIIYDIACQWSKRLFQRAAGFPGATDLALHPSTTVFAIPKGHIKAHGKTCQTKFSLNFLPGSGRTDGEGIEREWAHVNALVPSVSDSVLTVQTAMIKLNNNPTEGERM